LEHLYLEEHLELEVDMVLGSQATFLYQIKKEKET